MLPVVDFGVAIGLVVCFLLDVVLREGRCFVGGGDHVSCCVGAWEGFVLVLVQGSERKSTRTTGGDGDVKYTWPCKSSSLRKHDRIPQTLYYVSVGGWMG